MLFHIKPVEHFVEHLSDVKFSSKSRETYFLGIQFIRERWPVDQLIFRKIICSRIMNKNDVYTMEMFHLFECSKSMTVWRHFLYLKNKVYFSFENIILE